VDSSIISGLIGGLVAVIIGTIVTKAARRKNTNGELKHGLLIFILALSCLAFSIFAAWMFVYDEDVHEQTSEFVSVLLLFFGFGIAAIACFAEYFKVSGTFDSDSISFYTPWTGSKKESWDDLVTAKFNGSMYWYTLEFKSGKKVRLSAYLLGHGEVLDIVKERGFEL
jgi:hypothetical protein